MSKIEKLTDEDRDELFEANYRVCSKALRIIDQLTAALEAAEKRTGRAAWSDGNKTPFGAYDDVIDSRSDAERRVLSACENMHIRVSHGVPIAYDGVQAVIDAELAKRGWAGGDPEDSQALGRDALQAEVTRLTAALEASDEENGRLQRKVMASDSVAEAAESRAEALQARTAELEAENVRLKGTPDLDFPDALPQETDRQAAVRWYRRANAAETELATAKARVAELEAEHQRQYEAAQDWETHCRAAESELAQMRGQVERALTVYSYFEREDLPAEVALRRIAEVLRGR